MRTSLDEFLKELQEINTFVDSASSVYSTLANYGDDCITNSLTLRRRLDYLSFIIALYTSLEQYIEDLAWSFAALESSRNQYSQLHENLKDKHLKKSAELLFRGRLGEGRYTGLTNEDIVSNLNECLQDTDKYKLNRHAVVFHESNIRSEVIQGIFKAVGIENINPLACQTDLLTDWFSNAMGFEDAAENNLAKIIELRLRDLVDRRNQLVHAGPSSLEAFDPDLMKERLVFFEAYGRAIFNVVGSCYLNRYYIVNPLTNRFGSPTEGPYKNDYVVVIENPHCKIFQGQPVFGIRENKVVRWGKIIGIRIDNAPVKSIEADSSASSVGLELDFKLWKNIQLFGLEKKDEAIWE
ncbi:MAG: hypothetical protein A2W80_07120 [Candidatus Riflebacteria bacterium GWC2_50_8]|nr:MAG: hypothetical protein A2W80_07120 [Candidatus Riflebacteria bacterium GWC2_50_8]